MNERRQFGRKLGYGLAIVGLLLLLAWLSPPAAVETPDAPPTGGGQLARKRAQYGLAQGNLGDIDPTGEAIKLATLGMRGVAVNLLWHKATEAQKTRDWTALSAAVTQMIKLQPNFPGVWRFQGWNLAYNVSADWDDYRDRYFWVIRGINFLREGTKHNRQEPMLLWDVGWTTAQKIGRADERVQYRKLFRADDEFHGDRPVSQRDNWLVGQLAFREAEETVDRGAPLRGLSPVLFRSEAPRCQINYALALEDDGTFGEVARVAWDKASAVWEDYGNRDLPSFEGNTYRLNEYDRLLADQQQLASQLEALAPGMREKIHQEKVDALSRSERELLEKPPGDRTREDSMLIGALINRLQVTWPEVPPRIADEARRRQAEALLAKILKAEDLLNTVDVSRNQVMYPYWKTRCESESSEAALTTREQVFRGEQEFREADMVNARAAYEAAFAAWRQVLDKYPVLMTDGQTAEELLDVVRHYQECLKKLDEPFPQPFVLDELIRANQGYFDTPQ